MLFNSPEFLFLFLPLTLLFFSLAHQRDAVLAQLVLIAASLIFYAWWSPSFLLVLLVSIGVNFGLGMRLRVQPSRLLLTLGLLFNLTLLGFFKYYDFFVLNLNAVAGTSYSVLTLALPLGISFFTFQKIAYLVDCHQGHVQDSHPLRFLLFVMFFPQLIAGPIVHHREIIPQFASREKSGQPIDSQMIGHGLALLILGLFKKVVLADSLARYVNPAFADATHLQFFEAWVAVLSYTLELYFDFSAYSEMAMGMAKLFGIQLPVNFNSPYQATSIADFWRRWHITLGRFMRQYLYIPLGGNRHGLARAFSAAFITMLLGGLWHGSGWTFVGWGALHGVYLGAHRLWQTLNFPLPAWLARFITFFSVMMGWVLFRAASWNDAVAIWSTLMGAHGLVFPHGLQAIVDWSSWGVRYQVSALVNGLEPLILGVLFFGVFALPNVPNLIQHMTPRWFALMLLTFLAGVSFFQLSTPSEFLYFTF